MVGEWQSGHWLVAGKSRAFSVAVWQICHRQRLVVSKVVSSGVGKSARNNVPRKMSTLSLKRSISASYSFIYHIFVGEINKQVNN